MKHAVPGAPGADTIRSNPVAVGWLVAWTFGLAPALLFVFTWSTEFSRLQQMARIYALPVVAIQVAIVLLSVREGFRIGKPHWLPIALALAWAVHAWAGALTAHLIVPSILRTGIWTVQLCFALAIVNLRHHELLDLAENRKALLAGFLLVFLLLVTFVTTTDQTSEGRVWGLPAFVNVRWFGYYAAAAVGMAATGFLRGYRLELGAAAVAFAAMFWTGSRGPVLAATASLVACSLLVPTFRSSRVWLRFALCAVGGFGLAFLLSAVVPFDGQGPASMARFDDSLRIKVWLATVDYIRMRPLLGWGEAQFVYASGGAWGLAQPHNIVLQVLLAWGALGGLLCLALVIWIAPRFLKSQAAEVAPFRFAALALAAYSFIDGSLYYAQSLALFTFCCAAAIAAGFDERDERDGKSTA